VRERFEAVEMPLNRTNQSQNARHRVLAWVLIVPVSSIRLIRQDRQRCINRARFYGRGFGCVAVGVFLEELEMPKLMRKKRKPLRNDSRMDMEV